MLRSWNKKNIPGFRCSSNNLVAFELRGPTSVLVNTCLGPGSKCKCGAIASAGGWEYTVGVSAFHALKDIVFSVLELSSYSGVRREKEEMEGRTVGGYCILLRTGGG